MISSRVYLPARFSGKENPPPRNTRKRSYGIAALSMFNMRTPSNKKQQPQEKQNIISLLQGDRTNLPIQVRMESKL